MKKSALQENNFMENNINPRLLKALLLGPEDGLAPLLGMVDGGAPAALQLAALGVLNLLALPDPDFQQQVAWGWACVSLVAARPPMRNRA